MKMCKKCQIEKEDSDFYTRMRVCKKCRIEYQKNILDTDKRKQYVKEYYQKNKEEQLSLAKDWYYKNSDRAKENARKNYNKNKDSKLEYQKDYQKKNREKRNKYLSNRKKNDPIFRLKCVVYRIIGESLNYKKGEKEQLIF